MNSVLDSLKPIVKGVPIIGPLLVQLRQRHSPAPATPEVAPAQPPPPFTTSADYWERRYKEGDNSGPGSYGRLAVFKAKFLNRFVKQHRISSVIEFGCGDGSQLKLARYPKYVGVDVSTKAVDICRAVHANDPSKSFFHTDELPPDSTADLALSLDVIFHLVEDSVFDAYMRRLFAAARRFVVIYSSNMDQSWPNQHVRHREFTNWVARNEPAWRLDSTVNNRYPYDPEDPENTSFADFYVFWRT